MHTGTPAKPCFLFFFNTSEGLGLVAGDGWECWGAFAGAARRRWLGAVRVRVWSRVVVVVGCSPAVLGCKGACRVSSSAGPA